MKTRRGCPRQPKNASFPGQMRWSLICASSEAHLSLTSSRVDTRIGNQLVTVVAARPVTSPQPSGVCIHDGREDASDRDERSVFVAADRRLCASKSVLQSGGSSSRSLHMPTQPLKRSSPPPSLIAYGTNFSSSFPPHLLLLKRPPHFSSQPFPSRRALPAH